MSRGQLLCTCRLFQFHLEGILKEDPSASSPTVEIRFWAISVRRVSTKCMPVPRTDRSCIQFPESSWHLLGPFDASTDFSFKLNVEFRRF